MPTPHRPELNALFHKPPKEAVQYLKSKGYKFGWDWHQTLDDAHSRAFTVAKVAKLDLLQDIKKSLITALEQGQSFERWQADITPILQEKGWWGKKTVVNPAGQEQEVQLGSPRRLRTIYHTNMRSAFSAGRYKTMIESMDTRPYWEYRHITMTNYREEHKAWNGRILRADDPFWTVAYPPSKFGCNCRVIARSEREIEGKEILSSQGYQSQYSEKIGVDSFTGADIYATRQQFDIPTKDGVLTFSPAAGFNNSPATSYTIDQVLTERARKYIGDAEGLKQVQQILTAPLRQKSHLAFVENTINFSKAQGKTTTVGVLQAKEITFLLNKGQSLESPIMIIDDRLLIGKKAKRHQESDNALSMSEWQELPLLVAQPLHVLWDAKNESILWITSSLNTNNHQEVIKLAVRPMNGVMQIVSVFKVSLNSILGNVKSGLYETIQEE
ncbi:phage head morphogenesis protein [Acinetobacter sp. ANC 4558]|uniref:phage head morphogenesis protein n=1 Tax=Acinetobacter sp. ANC 4558 TaxID=1977876 RepID=UPI000A34A5A0|nr:phage minor head protein [Acinetobacter sp. ANC 4558]OTG87692.1 phage head morphogenesis protein [Acinetobacter sp. ANC 4558]